MDAAAYERERLLPIPTEFVGPSYGVLEESIHIVSAD